MPKTWASVRSVLPLLHGAVATLVWLIALVMMAQVFCRYVLNSSLSWSEEFSRYILVFITFTASLFLVRSDSLTAFELSNKAAAAGLFRRAINDGPAMVFFAALAVSAIELIYKTLGQHSVALGLPMWLVYVPMVAFGALGCFFLLAKVLARG